MLQSSIASLDGSLMAINRTFAWEVLCAFCLMEVSHHVELTHLVEVPCPTSCGNATRGKHYFHESASYI